MTQTLTVLMYHALANERGESPGADAHYSVSKRQFQAGLRLVGDAGKRCASMADLLSHRAAFDASVAFTFDDGHASNLAASEMIARAGGSADFFVNPSTVGTPHYLDWAALRAMAALGMSIQSHGYNHRYLDELTAQEVRTELVDSKKAIEDHLGQAVTLFAPPGGRVSPHLAEIAREAGYRAVCSSRVGLWRAGADAYDIPRLAVLTSTPDAQLERWIRQDALEIFGRRARYLLLQGAKQVLGTQGYERLRQGLLRSAP